MDKVLEQVLRTTADANIRFGDLRSLLLRIGFSERVKGSHHIFWKHGVDEILNLQPKGSKAKPYQVKIRRPGVSPKYEVIIYWSQDDEAFIAEVPELAGCAADGRSYQEALSNAEVAIQEWIETAKELGRQIPSPKGRLVFA